jgi:hypothetical protein
MKASNSTRKTRPLFDFHGRRLATALGLWPIASARAPQDRPGQPRENAGDEERGEARIFAGGASFDHLMQMAHRKAALRQGPVDCIEAKRKNGLLRPAMRFHPLQPAAQGPRYQEATLITVLQSVTKTSNNQPGALSARTIKALCGVLHDDHERRDSGLALFETFDSIDLMAISDASVLDAAVKKVGRVQVMADRIREELGRILPRKTVTKKTAGDDRKVVEFPVGHSAPAKDIVPLRKS